MAIIGNIHHIQKRLSKQNLNIIFDYLTQAVDTNSHVSQQLFSLPLNSFEKVALEDGIFAFLQVATTKPIDECFIESHKKYVDFQLLISGDEEMGYIDIEKLHVDVPYSEEKDLITYHMQDDFSKFLLKAQDLAIFFPEDGHIGLKMYKEKSLIRKIVIKVPLSLFEGTY